MLTHPMILPGNTLSPQLITESSCVSGSVLESELQGGGEREARNLLPLAMSVHSPMTTLPAEKRKTNTKFLPIG